MLHHPSPPHSGVGLTPLTGILTYQTENHTMCTEMQDLPANLTLVISVALMCLTLLVAGRTAKIGTSAKDPSVTSEPPRSRHTWED